MNPKLTTALLLMIAGLACNLPAPDFEALSGVESSATPVPRPQPTREAGSGLQPAQPGADRATEQADGAGTGLQPVGEPTATPVAPTPLPTVEIISDGGIQSLSEFGRPRLSGEAQVLVTEHFRIHYTRSGKDRVPDEDADGNGYPDYVELAAATFEYVWQVEINDFGWDAPPSDGGEGGDARYDVYLQNVLDEGEAGSTDGGYVQTTVGDNPNSAAVETRSSYSYIVLDNDYAELNRWGNAGISSTELLQVTAAHEFMHAIQYGYDGQEPAGWLWEAGATWMEDEVFDDVNDVIGELPSVYKAPDICQLSSGEERVESDGRWYGLWIYMRYLSERYGHAAVRAVWEYAREMDGYAAIEAALADAGASLDEVQRGYALALLLRDFEEGAEFPTLRLEGRARAAAPFVPADGVGQMAADYVQIEASAPVSVALDTPDLSGTLVGVRAGQASIFPLRSGRGTIDGGQFDYLYLIVSNLKRAAGEEDCAFTPYTLAVAATADAPALPAAVVPAPNFEPPQFEPLQEPDAFASAETIAAPPELIPAYLPEGYELADSYLLDKDEFGDAEEARWYVPGAGPATVLDFYGFGDDYLSITASDSPFNTLDGWLQALDYTPLPGERRALAGVEALVEDFSDDGGPFYSITFIHADQFIVVDGTLPLAEIVSVVESLIAVL